MDQAHGEEHRALGASSLPAGFTLPREVRAVSGLTKAAPLPGWASGRQRRTEWNPGSTARDAGEKSIVRMSV